MSRIDGFHCICTESYHTVIVFWPFCAIVFGFLQDSYSGIEQEPAHMVEVGYQKGAEQVGASLILNVVSVPGTASEQIYIKYFSELYSSVLCLTSHVTL